MKKVKNKQLSSKERLVALLDQYKKIQASSMNKIKKYQDMLQRPSSVKWNDKKKNRASARLSTAKLEYAQTFEIIDQIIFQLDRMMNDNV